VSVVVEVAADLYENGVGAWQPICETRDKMGRMSIWRETLIDVDGNGDVRLRLGL